MYLNKELCVGLTLFIQVKMYKYSFKYHVRETFLYFPCVSCVQYMYFLHAVTYEYYIDILGPQLPHTLTNIIHLPPGYQSILQRLVSTSTIAASSVKSDTNPTNNKSTRDLGQEFDLGFISHAECDSSLNHDVVRYENYV